jgi:hypothetical protein
MSSAKRLRTSISSSSRLLESRPTLFTFSEDFNSIHVNEIFKSHFKRIIRFFQSLCGLYVKLLVAGLMCARKNYAEKKVDKYAGCKYLLK